MRDRALHAAGDRPDLERRGEVRRDAPRGASGGRRLRASDMRRKDTLIVGRTHVVHDEPTTFGPKVLVAYGEDGRSLARLRRPRQAVAVGKLSGAVGNFAPLDPEIEEDVCGELGLEP